MFNELIRWSQKNFSDLPWRTDRSLYTTLVSEFMLQQTTVSTVLNHYHRFLKVFPTVHHLAKSSEEEVCLHWQGLGYYRRARNLYKAACYIVEHFSGEIPLDLDLLVKIPGIGEYTANALCSIGGGEKALAIDANIERVVSRLYFFREPKGSQLMKEVKKNFHEQKLFVGLSDKKYGELNEALMDLGREVCTSSSPKCLMCPIQKICKTYSLGEVSNIPYIVDKKKKTDQKNLELQLLRVMTRKNDELLVYQKSKEEWLSGQWELPTFVIKSDDKSLKQYPKASSSLTTFIASKKRPTLKKYQTTITKYKISNMILELSEKEWKKLALEDEDKDGKKYRFKNLNEKQNHFSTATMKALKKIKNKNEEKNRPDSV